MPQPILGCGLCACDIAAAATLLAAAAAPAAPGLGSCEVPSAAGLALLGAVDEKFVEVTDILQPSDDGRGSKAFVSRSYDATSHFETEMDDVLDLYTRITGKRLDLSAKDPAKAEGAD